MSNNLRIAIAQINLIVGDVQGNVAKIKNAAVTARDELNADLVLFPELTLTGYPPEDLLLRPGMQRRVDAGLQQLLAIPGIALVVGFPEQEGSQLYNSAALIHEGEFQAIYRKQQLPNHAVFDEKRYFTAGDRACSVLFKGVQLGLTICEDMWHSNTMKKICAAGAELILNLNASPFHLGKSKEREAVIRQRISESPIPIVYCNLVGGQDELVFDGASFVMNAQGEVIRRYESFKEVVALAEFDVSDGVVPMGGDCQEYLTDEASAYEAIVLGVKDYIQKNGFTGAVLGLSGGIDSALVLAIAVDAIGAENVEVVRMPSRFTADMSLVDAELEAEALGVKCHTIEIEAPFESFLSVLGAEFEEFNDKPWDTTEENIQARCRGILLMAISNKQGKIVLTTGNKSEMAVGYCTLYGDMAGGFAPIKDLPKTWVYRLCNYRNRLSPIIPQRVIDRPPSAELAPDQKDEDSLPSYEVLDAILAMYVEQDLCVEDIVALGYDEELVRQIVRLVSINEYKRRQAPPGVKIGYRAFGRDRRYPITSGYR